MKVFLLALALIALCVIGLCFNILVRKKDFPHYDVGSNEEMRKRGIRCYKDEGGIRCYKDEDAALHKKHCSGDYSDACKECKLYESGSNSRPA